MMKSEGLIRFGALLLIAVFLNAILMPNLASSKEPDCDFDKKKPSLAHARTVFDKDDFRCAGMELDALIKDKKTNIEDRAAARLLLVKVYNAMIHEDLNKPVEEPAQEPVDKPAPPPKETPKETPKDPVVEKPAVVQAQPMAIKSESGGKPWYKKWWAMALGVGVVATVAAVAGGGGEDSDEVEERTWLPPPPPPPGK